MFFSSVLGFISGAILGSFLEATSERVIKGEGLLGRSICLECKKKLRWFELFPIISYLALSGKCARCKKKIPLKLFISELSMGIILTLLFIQYPTNFSDPFSIINLLFKIFAISVFYLVLLVDLRTGLIHDRITYPAITITLVYWLIASLINALVINSYHIGRPLQYLFIDYLYQPALFLISGITLALFFALLIIITRGRGMGWGDVKYALFLGLVLGPTGTLLGAFLAFLSGSIVSLVLVALGKMKFNSTIPFGPYLSFGALITMIYGSEIMKIYLKVLTT